MKRASKVRLWQLIKYASLSIILVFGLASIIATGGGGGGSSSSGGGGSDTPEASAVIGPEGGVVEVTDPESPICGTKVEVPEGALNEPTPIKIFLEEKEKFVSNENKHSVGEYLIALSPSKMMFQKPYTLSFPLDDLSAQGPDDLLTILHYDTESSMWVELENIRIENDMIHGDGNSFSIFGIFTDDCIHYTTTDHRDNMKYPLLFMHGVKLPNLIDKIFDGYGDVEETFGSLLFYFYDIDEGGKNTINDYDIWGYNYYAHRSIRRTAGNLKKVIAAIKEATGKDKVLVVAHSMGGLVTRAYLQGYGITGVPRQPVIYDDDIFALITTGTPNRGSIWATLADNFMDWQDKLLGKLEWFVDPLFSTKSYEEMGPNSSFLDDLNNNSDYLLPSSVKYFTIYSIIKNDLGVNIGDSVVFDDPFGSEYSENRVACAELPDYTDGGAYIVAQVILDEDVHNQEYYHIKFGGEIMGGWVGWPKGIAFVEDRDHPTYLAIKSYLAEPTAKITSPSGDVTINEGGSVYFQGSVTGGDAPFDYLWDFDGGATNSDDEDPGYVTFNQVGIYTVTFTVTDDDGDTDSDSVKVTVRAEEFILKYSQDFSTDPAWTTNNPSRFYWDQPAETFYCMTVERADEYATVPVDWTGNSFKIEFDIKIASSQSASGISVGLLDSDRHDSQPDVVDVIYGHSDDGLHVKIHAANQNTSKTAPSYIQNIQHNVWYHNTVIWDNDTGEITLVLKERDSGNPIGTYTISGFTWFAFDMVNLGVSWVGHVASSNHTVSYIDNVRFYERIGGTAIDISGYWKVYHTTAEGTAGEKGPDYLTFDQLNNDVTIHDTCYPDESPEYSVDIDGTTISMSWTNDIGTTTSATGLISDDTMVGTYTETSGDSGIWRAEKTEQKPTLEDCIVSKTHVWCVRFPDDGYYVEGRIEDPNAIIESANISGDYVSGTSPLTYNLHASRPNEWWTDPNIFVSQGTEPDFPLDYIVHIDFKDGTSQNVSKTVTGWGWAQ